MSVAEPTASGPTCLFDHGPMQPTERGRWECIVCSFVVLVGTGAAADADVEGEGGNAA